MIRHLSSVLSAAGLVLATPLAADAATSRIRVPDRYDGSWSITAVTREGPCAASTSYQVRIKGSDASIPGEEVDIDGGVSGEGTVQATIRQGSNRVPITGNLDAAGQGSGTWQTSGGLVTCSGTWTAKRSG